MFDVSELVEDLAQSGSCVDQKIQIIVCDDHSPDLSFYEKLRQAYDSQKDVIILRNESNLGRSKTRNKLVKLAKHELVVFIDGDSRLYDVSTFVQRYLGVSKEDVVVGGTQYDAHQPPQSYKLHWRYGKARESKSAAYREKDPLRYFFSNNFMTKKSLLLKHPFDEKINQYGYEDSFWAKSMVENAYKIKHIDNFVIHKGLNNNNKFLENAQSAVSTLAAQTKANKTTSIYLQTFYLEKKNSRIGKILLYWAGFTQPLLGYLLGHGITSLRLYDLYRLGLLHNKMRN